MSRRSGLAAEEDNHSDISPLDDTQYKHLKNALDLRNGCGHPTGYQPDPVKLQGYYSDIAQLVLLNPKFA
jgi:hypothetical protein